MGIIRQSYLVLAVLSLSIWLQGCTQLVIDEYQAIATTTHTWRVEYILGGNQKRPRFEEFASDQVESINGEKPVTAAGQRDDKGVWWPPTPPKPSLEEIEERQKTGETHNSPELLRSVTYSIAYYQGGRLVTLPTNYQAYRQAIRAIAEGQSLKLTLTVDDQAIEKAEPF